MRPTPPTMPVMSGTPFVVTSEGWHVTDDLMNFFRSGLRNGHILQCTVDVVHRSVTRGRGERGANGGWPMVKVSGAAGFARSTSSTNQNGQINEIDQRGRSSLLPATRCERAPASFLLRSRTKYFSSNNPEQGPDSSGHRHGQGAPKSHPHRGGHDGSAAGARCQGTE